MARIDELDAPLLVCEPVLAEAMHLLDRLPVAQDALLSLLENGALRIALDVEDHILELRRLLRKYRDQPMSLGDACLIRMAELHDHHAILTLDSDFLVYRKHGRQPVDLIYPSAFA